MRNLPLESLFVRYRSHGDSGALAAVFDRVAPDLLRIARHFARRRSGAEDLVQETFLTAIERASTFDATRPLRPWLVGILANHAAAAARRAVPTSTEEIAEVAAPDSEPSRLAAERELLGELERAVTGLPSVYREVLLPRLREAAASADVAARVGRTPGVVRMQLARGMALLRLALPRGAFGLAMATEEWSHRRRWAAIRNEVLSRSEGVAQSVTGGSSVGWISVAGGWMTKQLVLCALVVVVVCGSAIYFASDDAAPLATTLVADAEKRERPALAAVGEAARLPAIAGAADVRVPAVATTADPPMEYRRHLSGIGGRLLEANGSPVAGTDVTLVEVRAADSLPARRDLPYVATFAPRVLVASTRTDEDGRFRLEGAHARGLHALGIDLGGPRAALELVFDSLSPGTIRDIGDVFLDPVVCFEGRVVDAEERPIAGATVKAAAFPLPPGTFGIQHLRKDSHVITHLPRKGTDAIALPPWVGALLERLPIPTATTDVDGRFRLTGVPTGTVHLLAQHDEFVAEIRGPIPSGREGARDVGTIVLQSGAPLHGRLVDHVGAPVGGGTIVAGAIPEIDVVVFAKAAVTASDGTFAIPDLPRDAELRIAARAHPADPWISFDLDDVAMLPSDPGLSISLPKSETWTVALIDEERNPIRAAKLLVPTYTAIEEIGDAYLPWAAPPSAGSANGGFPALEGQDGRYSFAMRPRAKFPLDVRADGFLPRRLEIEGPARDIEIVLERGSPRAVRVVAGEHEDPLEYALIGVYHPDESLFAMAQGRTDIDGRIHFDGLPRGTDLLVHVEHPGWPATTISMPPGDDGFEVRLAAAGELAGRLDPGDSQLRERYLVMLTRHGPVPDVDAFPRFASTDLRGEFEIAGIAPGKYALEIHSDLASGDPLRFDAKQLEELERLPRLHRTSVEIESALTTRIEIEFLPPDATTNGVIEGELRILGRARPGGVRAIHARTSSVTTGEDGRFRLEGIGAGKVSLEAWVVDEDGARLDAHRDLVLAPAETRHLVLDLERHPVEFRLVDPQDPNAEFKTHAHFEGCDDATRGLRFGAPIGARSRALYISKPGRYRVAFRDVALGSGATEFEVPAQGVVTLQFDRGVPCRGRLEFPEELLEAADGMLFFAVVAPLPGADSIEDSYSRLPARSHEFEFKGLSPGTIRLDFLADGRKARVEFELPESGATDLVLRPTMYE
jgi:RNA polymerase sigma factor (sigma-70 family)